MSTSATHSPLGSALPHHNALDHVSGAARYVDDLPEPAGLLHAMALGSEHAHGRIVAVRTRGALEVPGVHAVLVAGDVPGANNVGPIFHDEPVLAAGEVHCVGQPVAVVYAEHREACREALARIEVDVEPLAAVLDIDAAIAAGSEHGEPHVIRRGDAAGAIARAPHRLSGTASSGGQEHFYLETHCALSVPGEDQSVHVTSSTQHPSEVQALVAEVLGWGRHRVVVSCTRMGGAFGGKETQAAQFAALAALGTWATGRPVKCWLDRDTDMGTTGRRHPAQTRWDVGFDERGRVLGFQAEVWADGGWAADLSLSILDRCLFHLDNCYWLPEVQLTGHVARTNRTSNTAFRGFGGPQGVVVIERVLDAIAATLALDPLEVRRRNFYRDGADHTPYGQHVPECRAEAIAAQLAASAELGARRAAIEAFNATQRWRKRALALSPVKFGISFTASFLNQAGALVQLYQDGTAQLNHGGTEMGQGLYTKMLAVCAHALGVPLASVRHMPTSTDKVPNTSATAASSGADLNGQAVYVACAKLVARLRPVAAELLGLDEAEVVLAAGARERPERDGVPLWAWRPDGTGVTLGAVARAAYLRQISMSATGYYRTPNIAYDRAAGHGTPFHYFAYGAAVSEVEVDGLTGEWTLRRVDVLHDVGDTLSSDIDIGQIEGAFVQGLGWLTMEELVFGDDGRLVSHSPSTYKIPAIGDVPEDFRVALLERAAQPGVIYGSKAVGEPPFMLAISAWLALGRATAAFASGPRVPDLEIPATTEAVLFAVERARAQVP